MAKLFPNDVIDDAVREQHSVEFWVKPSHTMLGRWFAVGDTRTRPEFCLTACWLSLAGTGKIQQRCITPAACGLASQPAQ